MTTEKGNITIIYTKKEVEEAMINNDIYSSFIIYNDGMLGIQTSKIHHQQLIIIGIKI